MATSTVMGPVRKALKAAVVTAINDPAVQVALGFPWPQEAQDIIALGDGRSTVDVATMGQARSRDETLSIDLTVSVFRPGGQEQAEVAQDRAYELLAAIEHHLRTTDPTLGGLVRQCLLTEHEIASEPFDDGTTMGRTVEVAATFTALARFRN